MHNRSSIVKRNPFPLKHRVIDWRPPEVLLNREPIRRLRDGQPMTIAGCFKFDDGVLFCADTKITAAAKTTQSKISDRVYSGARCATVFVLAGSVAFARSAIKACEDRVAALDHLRVTFDGIQAEIQEVLSDFYQSHVYPRPDRDAIDFGLLIGVWLRGETRMFVTEDTAVNPVTEYECIGVGAYLAKYWVKQFFDSQERWKDATRPLEDVALISAFALKSVMDYDESCGGEAEFIVMKANGEFAYELDSPVSLYRANELPQRMFAEVWRLLRAIVRAPEREDAALSLYDFEAAVERSLKERADWIRAVTAGFDKPSSEPGAAETDPKTTKEQPDTEGGAKEEEP